MSKIGIKGTRPWSEELDKVYAAHGVYDELASRLHQQLLLPNMDGMKVKRNGAPRFPPKSKVELPPALVDSRLPAFDMEEASSLLHPAKKGKLSADLMKLMKELEEVLATLYEQICANRDSCRRHGSYLYNLGNPPLEKVLNIIRQNVTREVKKLLDDAVTLVNNVELVRKKKIRDVLPEEVATSNTMFSTWSQFMTRRCEVLRLEASKSEIVLHNLLDLAEDLITTNIGTTCKLDGIEPDWSSLGNFKSQIKTSNKAICYVAWMEARGLPICDAVFEFMQSPTQHAFILTIVGYSFAPRELCELLEFIATNAGRTPLITPINPDGTNGTGAHHAGDKDDDAASENLYKLLKTKSPLYMSNSVHHLSLDECMLNDYDMSTIALHLPALSSLHTLCLRGNAITSVGATSIATSLWDTASEIKTLRLDRNNIGTDGVLSLSKAIHRCRYLSSLSLSFNPVGDVGMFYILRALMNPARKARAFLPRPFELSQKDGAYDYEDDIQSTYSDDEDWVYNKSSPGRSDYFEKSDDGENSNASDAADNEYIRGGGSTAGTESDVYTMGADNEDVYSISMSRRSSVQLNESVASMSLTWLSSKFDNLSLSRMPLFLRKFRLVRFKMIAVSAFRRIQSRGHSLSSLSVAGCGLTSFSLSLVAHALVDNINIGILDLSSNPLGMDDTGDADAGDDDDGDVATSTNFDVTHVLDFAQNHTSSKMNKRRLREAILLAKANGEQYESMLFEISRGTGINVDKLENVVFPAILYKDRKEIFADIVCSTGLSSLTMRSCGLLDRDVQIIVQLLNKACSSSRKYQRECVESNTLGLLRNADCVENSSKLITMLKSLGIDLGDISNDSQYQKTLLSADKFEVEHITNFLRPEFQKSFIKSFQRNCSLQSLDLSDNLLGPTSANWIAAATGHYFLDDLQLSLGYRAPILLPRKTKVGSGTTLRGGHLSRRQSATIPHDDFNDEELSDDGQSQSNQGTRSQDTTDYWEELSPRKLLHDVKVGLRKGGRNLAKKLFDTEARRKEML